MVLVNLLSLIKDIFNLKIENNQMIKSVKEYVHEDFYAIEYLKKGIIYLHGKMPENVKEYLEYKFSKCRELQFLYSGSIFP